MKRALFSALLVVCALVLPASASAGTITFNSPANGSITSTGTTINLQLTGPVESTSCSLDQPSPLTDLGPMSCDALMGTPAGGTYNWPVSLNADGLYTFSIEVTFEDSPVVSDGVSFRKDTTDPIVAITAGPTDGGFLTSDATDISFTVTEANPGTTSCGTGVNPALWTTPCTSTHSFTGLPEGAIVVGVKHVDLSGKTGVASRSVTVDTVPPVINLVGVANGTVVPTPYPQFSLSSSEGTFECFYDNNPSLTCQSISVSPTGLPDGAHTMHIIATDAAGNVATLVVSFTVDDSLAPPDQAPLPTGPRPSKVNLKKTKSVVSGSKVKTTFSGSFTIRGGGVDWNNACTGRVTVKFTGKVKGKTKSYSKRASLKRKGSSCTFKGTASLPRAWKGKRVKTTVSHAGNAGIGKFAVSGGFRP